MPKDTITVYEDRYNKDLIDAIQHDESKIQTVSSLKLKVAAETAVLKHSLIQSQQKRKNKDKKIKKKEFQTNNRQ